MSKTIVSLAIAFVLLMSYAPLSHAQTFFGPDFAVTPASIISGGTVTMQLSTSSGPGFTAPPTGGALCNPTDPSTCTFLLQSCPTMNYYQINQATIRTPNQGSFMLGSATTSGLTDPSIGRFTGSTGNYPAKAFAPAINLSSSDTGSIPFGTGVGGFFALTSNLPNPPNNVNPEGPYYWWTVSGGLRLDQTSLVPTSTPGTYGFDLEGLVFCGTTVLFFDALMQFTVSGKTSPTLSTSSTPATITLPSTQTVVDTATVTGGSSQLAGTVDFALFAGTTCSGTPVFTATGVPLVVSPAGSGMGTASSGGAIPAGGWAVGTYTWQVSFTATDSNDNSISAQCGGTNEVVTVNSPPPGLATRTPGYWATHVPFTEYVFDNQLGGHIQIGSCLTINDHDDLLGGFWSSIPQTSTGGHRSDLDQARMQLMQQLIAAILNNAADGSTPNGITLTQAGKDFCTGSAATILNDVGLLDTFNNSGDNIAFPANTPGLSLQNISVGGSVAKGLSDFVFWDVMPGDSGFPVATDSGWS